MSICAPKIIIIDYSVQKNSTVISLFVAQIIILYHVGNSFLYAEAIDCKD